MTTFTPAIYVDGALVASGIVAASIVLMGE